MSNTTPKAYLELYKTNIKPEANGLFEDLESYLQSLRDVAGSYLSLDIQYQKHDLMLTLKLNFAEYLQTYFAYNYCSIKNSFLTESPMYYFITSVIPVAQDTLQLTLVLDTINSLGIEPDDFLKTTRIYRSHKDRFKKPDSWDPEEGGGLIKKIDKYVEDTSVAVTQKTRDWTIKSDDNDYNWYVIYSSPNATPDPEDALQINICADEPVQIGNQMQTKVTSFKDNKIIINGTESPFAYTYYYVTENDATISYQYSTWGSNSITVGKNVNIGSAYQPLTVKVLAIRFSTSGSRLKIEILYYDTLTASNKWIDANNIVMVHLFGHIKTAQLDYHGYYYGYSVNTTDPSDPEEHGQVFSNRLPLPDTLTAISDIDRTNSKIVNIICLPYCPISYTKKSDVYYFTDINWEKEGGASITTGTLKFNGREPNLINNNVKSISMQQYMMKLFNPNEVQATHDIDISNETKLDNSQYFTAKITYDNYNIPLNIEQFDSGDPTKPDELRITQKATSIGNSTFGFQLWPDEGVVYNSQEDYDMSIVVNRNNEIPLYHSAYLDYMRTGYNYDRKANDLAVKQAITSAAAGVFTGGLTAGTRFATIGGGKTVANVLADRTAAQWEREAMTGGGWLHYLGSNKVISAIKQGTFSGLVPDDSDKIAAAVAQSKVNQQSLGIAAAAGGAAISQLITSAVDISNMKQTQELAMESKVAGLQAQATGISTNNDFQLLQWYNNNKLHLFEYRPTEEVRKALNMYFHRFGYSTYEYGTPDVTTRYYFNYIQCNPEISVNKLGKFKADWIADLKSRYNAGVTVYHLHDQTYNFNQNYENYEKWLVEGIS